MECPGCGHNNLPGMINCSLCSAPLFKTQLLNDVPKKVLLSTTQKPINIYFYISIALIILFSSYFFHLYNNFKRSLNEQENALLTSQLIQRKALLKEIQQY